MPDVTILALMMLVVLGSFVAKGATGFGESLIMVPLFLLLVDFKIALPVALVATGASDIYLLWHHHKEIHRRGVWIVLALELVGVALGTLGLRGLDAAFLQKCFAVVVLAFAIKLLFFDRPAAAGRTPHPLWGGLTGLAAGGIDAAFGTGGPPLVIYVSYLRLSRAAFRATLVLMAFGLSSSRMVAYSVAGLMSWEILATGALLVVPMVLGALLGRRLHEHLNEELFRRGTALLLLVIGVKLLW